MVLVAACVAPVDHGAEVDPLTGEVTTDERAATLSDADTAAIEIALRLGEAWGAPVMVVTVGPSSAEPALREALACGAARAVRVHALEPLAAAQVATMMATVLGDAGADVVCCGDQGSSGGSGAVPAFVAAELGVAAALGLIEVAPAVGPVGRLTAVRRLDGGRREHLSVSTPAVLSVEGAAARLRRAGLEGVLAAGKATIEVVPAAVVGAAGAVRLGVPRPYRPRPRVVPAPVGDSALERVRALTGAGVAAAGVRRAPVVASPDHAAQLILDALGEWGYEIAVAERTTR